jgi:transcriptional regulator with XRE-family HTH domain
MSQEPMPANERKQPPGTMPEEVFARRIQERRRVLGWSQVALSQHLAEVFGFKLDATAITRIEQGKRRVQLDEAVAITTVMNMDLHEVVAPHPGSLEDQVERAHMAMENARYAADYWKGEFELASRRLEHVRDLQQQEREQYERMREIISQARARGEAAADGVDQETP